ncbi:glycosyltransferase family 2 protein [Kutzneria viridogrisea]|uniref:Glycosyl transferase family 2 n=2 Tax=Kutzneria TaxID=43356 RepID=W5W055_9PSEU|nr:glycosyltransferase [Kutzneria albida]AHH94583.1 glycosyl transferase family 2 [Kutzneria albida DSM 43870]MBA8930251.1 hypothetical protein [Kutzneria viridogrisea]
MPLFSVLTAAIGQWAEYVELAGESLAAQRLPEGWQLEWVVQEDGDEPVLAEVVGRFEFARYQANGQQLGTTSTRNLGLTRVSGELTHVFDCDDLLLPDALATALAAFERHPEIHWFAGQADNLMPDGSRVAFDPISPTGPVAPGAVNDYLLSTDRAPFLPNTLAVRTTTLRALGGWSATPNGEDTMVLAALGELTPGYYAPEVTWLYRQHERQTSRTQVWANRLPVALDMVRQRIAALRELGLRLGSD